jgi:hypothetical protein
MRRLVFAAAAALSLAACASKPAPDAPPSPLTTSAGTWTYAFDAGPGLASATLSGPDGQPALRVTCEAPRGDLIVTDWTFSRARQGDVQATVSVGGASKPVPARIAGDGAGRIALMTTLPPRDPLFAALTPNAPVKTVAAGYTHIWAAGAASRINDVINSCRTLGS